LPKMTRSTLATTAPIRVASPLLSIALSQPFVAEFEPCGPV
jgi:hypothetical protein